MDDADLKKNLLEVRARIESIRTGYANNHCGWMIDGESDVRALQVKERDLMAKLIGELESING